jgi:hypothetical protein
MTIRPRLGTLRWNFDALRALALARLRLRVVGRRVVARMWTLAVVAGDPRTPLLPLRQEMHHDNGRLR